MRVGFITEGATDQIVLRTIVETVLDNRFIAFNSLQPNLDESETQIGFGGWEKVFDSLRTLDFDLLLEINDLIVVQIDSDVSFKKGFDVEHAAPGKKVDPVRLCKEVIQRLTCELPSTLDSLQLQRILFAIGIHSIECWLIGLVDANHNSKIIGSCFMKLNIGLAKNKLGKISSNSKNKGASQNTYRTLASKLSKSKTLLQQSKLNAGFASFVAQLQAFAPSALPHGQ